MSDTPKTDAKAFDITTGNPDADGVVMADFARELERAATNWEDVYRVQSARIAELERENEFLLNALERLADDLERLAKRLKNGLESVQKKEAQP